MSKRLALPRSGAVCFVIAFWSGIVGISHSTIPVFFFSNQFSLFKTIYGAVAPFPAGHIQRRSESFVVGLIFKLVDLRFAVFAELNDNSFPRHETREWLFVFRMRQPRGISRELNAVMRIHLADLQFSDRVVAVD